MPCISCPPIKASELIEQLQALIAKHGDLPVMFAYLTSKQSMLRNRNMTPTAMGRLLYSLAENNRQ